MFSEISDIENLIKEMFEENFERLKAESGHSLSPELKETALLQVRAYWKKLSEIAESVTETEVKLCLPNLKSPSGNVNYCIEGVVDIVREDDHTTMYDIKTHDLGFIFENMGFYEKQLNIYAYIWQNLRGERLDETAIISTPVPDEVRDAINNDDYDQFVSELEKWNPVVNIPINPETIESTIEEFGHIVDAIEARNFSCQSIEKLKSKDVDGYFFGTRVCRNCDARFSCPSYREFAKRPKQRNAKSFGVFFSNFLDQENEQWKDSSVPSSGESIDVEEEV